MNYNFDLISKDIVYLNCKKLCLVAYPLRLSKTAPHATLNHVGDKLDFCIWPLCMPDCSVEAGTSISGLSTVYIYEGF